MSRAGGRGQGRGQGQGRGYETYTAYSRYVVVGALPVEDTLQTSVQTLLMPPPDLRDIDDVEARARHFSMFTDDSEAEKQRRLVADLKAMQANGWRYWIPDKDPRLRRLAPDMPHLLFVAGELDLSRPAVAIVGSRKPDEYGEAICRILTTTLATAGVMIVSGGALGIEGIAHTPALEAGGKTTVVLGSGLQKPHPHTHKSLFSKIVQSGSAIISELPPSFPAAKFTFPARNLIIADLSDAVVVIQAGENSGALITAAWAQAANIPCFAVPGDIWYQMSAGTLSLLRSQTTKPLISPADLATVPELQSLINAKWPRLTNRPWGIPNSWIKATAPQQPKGDPASTAIIQAIGSNVLSADTLATKVDIPAGLLAAKLIELELLGMIIKLPDGTYMSTQNTTPKDP